MNQLPEGSQKITSYKGHAFNNYFVAPDKTLYFHNGQKILPLTPYQDKTGRKYYKVYDVEHNRRSLAYESIQKGKITTGSFDSKEEIKPPKKSKYIFPSNYPRITSYQGHIIENYCFNPDDFSIYFDDGVKYSYIKPYEKNNRKYVKLVDAENIRRTVSLKLLFEDYRQKQKEKREKEFQELFSQASTLSKSSSDPISE